MPDLSADTRRRVEELATRHGVSAGAATTLLEAITAGSGMAQFNHPELGGMGQWSPGMTMIGDMFNSGLKQRVEALCTDLAALVRDLPAGAAAAPGHAAGAQAGWWPAELGTPASAGGQNDMRYAYFPAAHRLAVQQGGRISLYDTGSAEILGMSQQQGSSQSLTVSTRQGPRRLEDFSRL